MKDKKLVIVESPTKAKTISKILGKDYTVVSSMGHVVDLPQNKLGVDIEDNFSPHYVIIRGREKILKNLKDEAKKKDVIYVATDPDREGEAIGWQIKNRVFDKKSVLRVVFHEITPLAVNNAFKSPRGFDHKMIEAQVGRRILDRIVGYFLSPLLWKKIGRGLSAGRVQSVALRLIVEREKKIQGFTPQEYWQIESELSKKNQPPSFKAKLEKVNGENINIPNQDESERIKKDIETKEFRVSDIREKEKKKNPYPPFITSTLQQEAFNKLRFNATKTMIIAQHLYEGVDIGQDIPVGLITYMRTDSTHVAPEAIREARDYILKNFGQEYLPDKHNVFKSKKGAQEAHEAIRPTLIDHPPEKLKDFLSTDQYKLYELIYRRFIASQMNPALYRSVSVDINAGQYLFIATKTSMVFQGFTVIFGLETEEEEGSQEEDVLPLLEKGEVLDLLKLLPSQHFTKPPARFSDSSLVKMLEEEGIGRPSTYAPIVSTLLNRNYVRRIKGYLHPTELGFKVCGLLIDYFPKIMDVKFTALMEEELDEIEEGRLKKEDVLKEFYASFKDKLDFAQQNIKKEIVTTDQVCDKCGRPMVIKWGRKGKFLSCSGFPECRNSKSISSGVKCPEPGCGGELVERRFKRGFFYGCSNFPRCKFTSRNLPQEEKETDG